MFLIIIFIVFYQLRTSFIQAQLVGDAKIVGGAEATINNYPYQVSIESNGRHICGGSIISTTTIVTAAHCIEGREPNSIVIRAGSSTMMSGGIAIPARAFRIHPQFDSSTLNFDLALIYLSVPLSFSDTIQLIPLSSARLCGNNNVVASGWGTTAEAGSLSQTLRSVQMQIISYRACAQTYGTGLGSGMFCAGTMTGGKDTCQGDSGGPLAMKGELVGVTSHGTGCGRVGFPGMYTRIPLTRDWILQYIGG